MISLLAGRVFSFYCLQNNSGIYRASYTVGNIGRFSELKRPERETCHSSTPVSRLRKRRATTPSTPYFTACSLIKHRKALFCTHVTFLGIIERGTKLQACFSYSHLALLGLNFTLLSAVRFEVF